MEVTEETNSTRHIKPILVVDDTAGVKDAISKILQKEGYSVITASDGEEGINLLQKYDIPLVLTDLKMPKVDGAELLKVAKTISADIEVILITGYGTVEVAVEVMKQGAFDFIQKPVDKTTILNRVRNALEKQSLRLENRWLHEQLKTIQSSGTIIGKSAVMRKVMDLVGQVASSSATILVTGESGVGKEVIAQAIHDQSVRKNKPFIKVSCAALPETLLEAELFGYERGAFTGAIQQKAGQIQV